MTAPIPAPATSGQRETAEERAARLAADFDAKYRRCAEHNRARYWCGCYYADQRASGQRETCRAGVVGAPCEHGFERQHHTCCDALWSHDPWCSAAAAVSGGQPTTGDEAPAPYSAEAADELVRDLAADLGVEPKPRPGRELREQIVSILSALDQWGDDLDPIQVRALRRALRRAVDGAR